MNEVLRFPVERISKPAKRPAKQAGEAQILFFSGVRYSQMADNPVGTKVRKPKKNTSRIRH